MKSMIEREDLGSWLNGAPSNQKYPGEHLGRPQKGPGAIARPGIRLIGFLIDWYVCYLPILLFADNDPLLTLLVFWGYTVLLTGFMGHTLGHLAVGVQVQTLNGRPAGWLKGLIRGTLTMLILPAVIMDSDARGIHDRICKTVLMRIR